ncbi:MAG: ribose-5-phosphate isomerase RpiA [Pseudomonadota bacterium]
MQAPDPKEAVGLAAAQLVQSGMVVGLGTGSTAAKFVSALGRRAWDERLDLVCVATSRATAAQAVEEGLKVVELDEAPPIDLCIDGADEIDPALALIKGGGGALLREKLVWEAAKRCVVIADASKKVARLGAFALPVEVVSFGHTTTAGRLSGLLKDLGYVVEPKLRLNRTGAPFETDNGGLIYDLALGAIEDAEFLASALKGITGVVEHGLFIGLAQEALIAAGGAVERLTLEA